MMKKIIKRPSKDAYYLNIAREVANRSTCLSSHIGSLIVRDDQIIATGYNGAPRGTKDCMERGECLRRTLGIPSGQQYELCRSVHAEQNAIINAARAGVNVLGGTLYMYGTRVWEGDQTIFAAFPCFICKKMVINSGIKYCVVCNKDGAAERYSVEEWANEWKEKDMLDSMQQYSANYTSKK